MRDTHPRPDVPSPITTDQHYFDAILDALNDIRDRLPAPPREQPEPETSPAVGPLQIREPAVSAAPAATPAEPQRPARAGNRRAKGRT